jgi:hypothetical protein
MIRGNPRRARIYAAIAVIYVACAVLYSMQIFAYGDRHATTRFALAIFVASAAAFVYFAYCTWRGIE